MLNCRDTLRFRKPQSRKTPIPFLISLFINNFFFLHHTLSVHSPNMYTELETLLHFINFSHEIKVSLQWMVVKETSVSPRVDVIDRYKGKHM